MTDVDLLRTLNLAGTFLVVFCWLAFAARSLTTFRASLWCHFYVKTVSEWLIGGRKNPKA
mgnify:CR=1 FL=1